MKLQDRKAHDEKNVAGHMSLLFQTVMQLLSLVGSNLREPNRVNTKDVNIPSQKELERFSGQIEHALKENEELKSKLLRQEQRIHQLESGGAGRNETLFRIHLQQIKNQRWSSHGEFIMKKLKQLT